MPKKAAKRPNPAAALTFNAQEFLDSAGVARKITEFKKKETIFSQGDSCGNVLYIQTGGVRLSVVNETGKEAVVAILGPGDFLERDASPARRFASGRRERLHRILRWSSRNPR